MMLQSAILKNGGHFVILHVWQVWIRELQKHNVQAKY